MFWLRLLWLRFVCFWWGHIWLFGDRLVFDVHGMQVPSRFRQCLRCRVRESV